MTELNQTLLQFKHKLNMHYMERNSNNLNVEYIQYLESNIERILLLMKDVQLMNERTAA